MEESVLVVANVTATSQELLDALRSRAADQPTAFTLIVPATQAGGGRSVAAQTLAQAVSQLRDAGFEVDGSVGDGDPIVAVTEAWDPKRFDEILISTLPTRFSKWLHAGLPERVAKLTGAPITHVVSAPPKRDYATVHPPGHDSQGVISPLSVLGWGSSRSDAGR